MSEKTVKPKIDDVINKALTGDAQMNALDFADYLRANEMTIDGDAPCWGINYKAKDVCVLFVTGEADTPGPWTVWLDDNDYNELEDFPIDEQTKETAWAHANICGHFSSGGTDCGCGKQPGRTKTIFGKDFDNICTSTFMFTNPNAKTLECVKKLVKLRKSVISNECTV